MRMSMKSRKELNREVAGRYRATSRKDQGIIFTSLYHHLAIIATALLLRQYGKKHHTIVFRVDLVLTQHLYFCAIENKSRNSYRKRQFPHP